MEAIADLQRSPSGRDSCVQSLVRALGLLDQLISHDQGLTLTEVARLMDLPRSTAHRLLTTMESMRYVAFDATTNQWMIGARARAFGGGGFDAQDLTRLARPILQSLRLSTGATVTISVRGVDHVRYLAQSRVPGERRPIPLPGDHLPLHTAAAGKVLLAHLRDADLEAFLAQGPLAARTAASITTVALLRRELETVRAQGYAVDDQESLAGVRGVAAAVRDRNGEVRAALSASGSLLRLSDSRIRSLGDTLRFAARRMTEDFGSAIAA